jgi:hypothetical protein
MGYIYILTNPSFKDYVKIGYADNVEERVAQLNRTECTPFAFRIYATYKVSERLRDIPVHSLIDQLNPTLRSIDDVDGKPRVREFYAMTPEAAYSILESIAKINGCEGNLSYYKKTKAEVEEEQEDVKTADEISKMVANRHHFDTITFSSSLTGKEYKTGMGENGVLKLYETATDEEVPNNSKPSKKQIDFPKRDGRQKVGDAGRQGFVRL